MRSMCGVGSLVVERVIFFVQADVSELRQSRCRGPAPAAGDVDLSSRTLGKGKLLMQKPTAIMLIFSKLDLHFRMRLYHSDTIAIPDAGGKGRIHTIALTASPGKHCRGLRSRRQRAGPEATGIGRQSSWFRTETLAAAIWPWRLAAQPAGLR